MEIIIVDGKSIDSTRQLVARAAAADSRIRLVDNPRRIMAAGFNAGLKTVRGDVVVMLGGHTELPKNYLRTCSTLLRRGVADCVGGPMITRGQGRMAQAISLAMSSRFGVGGVAFRTGCRAPKYVDTVAYGAYSREIIEHIGPLDEEFVRGQDDEFNYRLRKLGGRILIVPEIASTYTSRSSLGSLWRQYFQYGFWKVRVLQKHPRQMQVRQFVPALFISCCGLLCAAAPFRPVMASRLLLFAGGFYLCATGFASLYLGLTRGKWWMAPALAMTFPVLHFSYGTGFLVGLVRFFKRWR